MCVFHGSQMARTRWRYVEWGPRWAWLIKELIIQIIAQEVREVYQYWQTKWNKSYNAQLSSSLRMVHWLRHKNEINIFSTYSKEKGNFPPLSFSLSFLQKWTQVLIVETYLKWLSEGNKDRILVTHSKHELTIALKTFYLATNKALSFNLFLFLHEAYQPLIY